MNMKDGEIFQTVDGGGGSSSGGTIATGGSTISSAGHNQFR